MLGVGAAVAGASAACPVAGLVLAPVGQKAKAIVKDPGIVHAFAKDMKERMGDPEDPESRGVCAALRDKFKEYAVTKGLDTVWDDLEPYASHLHLERKQPLAHLCV